MPIVRRPCGSRFRVTDADESSALSDGSSPATDAGKTTPIASGGGTPPRDLSILSVDPPLAFAKYQSESGRGYAVIGSVTALEAEASAHIYALPPGTRLQEFVIESVLGHGGFGITYLAKDTSNNDTVAIKEYLPGEMAVRVSNSTVRARSSDDQKLFNDGVYSFLAEAKRIARVVHPNIMEVRKFFTMNGTAYIALRYERGKTLKQRLDTPISEKSLRAIMDGLLQGIAAIHDHDKALLHRDIKPANIILSRNRSEREETPVLIDFGAAREFSNRNSRSVTALVSQGYSPPEQYGAGGQQGPWTDLYALGATAYRCATGEAPPDSLSRLGKDPIVPAAIKAREKYSDDLLRLIDWMMMVKEEARPQSAHIALQALRASGPGIAGAGDTAGRLKILDDGPDHFVLQFDRPPNGDVLGLAFRMTPPGRFLAPGRTARFGTEPHYFNLDRVENEAGQIGFRGGPEIRRRLRRSAGVGISSSDGTINVTAKWPLTSGASAPGVAGTGFSTRTVVTTALCLVAFGAAAVNIGTIHDAICDKTGICTAQQLLFRTASECVARTPSCGADTCLRNLRNDATLPRLIEKMGALEAAANTSCRNEEATSYQKAQACAEEATSARSGSPNSGACKVATCYASYLSDHPNAEHVAEVRTRVAGARQACSAPGAGGTPAAPQQRPTLTPTPPMAQPRPPQAPVAPPAEPVQTPQAQTPQTPPPPPPRPATPTAALPDGTYTAIRSFVDAKSVSDPASCPPSTSIQVTVRGSVLSFENYESNTGITRKWKGTMKSDGKISFLGSEATPPTANYLTILGDYNAAEINSRFCGKGYFKITR